MAPVETRPRTRPDPWVWAPLSAYAALLALLLSRHDPWYDEVHAWQKAVRSPSLAALFAALKDEVHGAIWYLLLRAAGSIWHSVDAMLALHWLIGTANAFLILRFCPLPRWQRIACCFGYYFLFEYGVICRNYSIGILLLLCFVVVQARFPRATLGPALLLALAIHTNLFAGMLSTALLVWLLADRWRSASPTVRLAASGILCASWILMAWYATDPGVSAAGTRALRYMIGHLRVVSGYSALFFAQTVMPIPDPRTVQFWNTFWLDSVLPERLGRWIEYPIALVALAAAWMAFRRRLSTKLLFLSGTILLRASPCSGWK